MTVAHQTFGPRSFSMVGTLCLRRNLRRVSEDDRWFKGGRTRFAEAERCRMAFMSRFPEMWQPCSWRGVYQVPLRYLPDTDQVSGRHLIGISRMPDVSDASAVDCGYLIWLASSRIQDK